MDLTQVKAGKNFPHDINVLIEIPANVNPIKYEFDKDAGAMIVDRFLATPMYYPANYGFIPNTLAPDGDAVDVLVITEFPLVPGCIINARPIGVLNMEDEAGQDDKILAVPSDKLTKAFSNINEIDDLAPGYIDKIRHFFERYKDLEKNKWVKLTGWENSAVAKDKISKTLI